MFGQQGNTQEGFTGAKYRKLLHCLTLFSKRVPVCQISSATNREVIAGMQLANSVYCPPQVSIYTPIAQIATRSGKLRRVFKLKFPTMFMYIAILYCELTLTSSNC